MTVTVIRTVIVYLVLTLCVRLMGKRQLGQLQPAEFVFSILISNIIAMPIEDPERPMLTAIVSVLLLSALEVLVSGLTMKSARLRRLAEGKPALIIEKGKLCVENMRALRYTADDVLEALRKKDIFDITTVAYAVAETDGTLSVLLKAANQPAEKQDVGGEGDDELRCTLVQDGEAICEPFLGKRFTDEEIERFVKKTGKRRGDLLILDVTGSGKTAAIEKQPSSPEQKKRRQRK